MVETIGGLCVPAGDDNEVLAIRDRFGRLRAQFDPADDSTVLFVPGTEVSFRMADGKLEISCPAGLRFITPGAIEFSAGEGVRLATENSSLDLTRTGIRAAGDNLALSAEYMTLSGGTMKARFERLTITAGKIEQFAGSIIQEVRNFYQRVEALLHTRAARIRTEASESHLIQAGSVRVVADEDVRIQAESINLG